jgi:hypothetical protein
LYDEKLKKKHNEEGNVLVKCCCCCFDRQLEENQFEKSYKAGKSTEYSLVISRPFSGQDQCNSST